MIASRPSLNEARSYILENGWQNAASVFKSDNGWYAIAVDLVPVRAAASILDSRKRSGVYPHDAYCSTGQKYIRRVDWRTTNAPAAVPVSTGLWEEFDARPLSTAEKGFLQAALAMEGYYNGLLDGIWGNGSQRALERYTAAEFDTDKPANAHAAWLAAGILNEWVEGGWEYQLIDHLAISAMLPLENMRITEEAGPKVRWEHNSLPLTVILDDLRSQRLLEVHSGFANYNRAIGEPYTLRGDDTWVTSVRSSDGTAYVRSDLIQGTWSTISVFADAELSGELALIAASIQPGPPQDIVPAESGYLVRYTKDLGRFLEEDTDEEDRYEAPEQPGALARAAPPETPGAPKDDKSGSSGTAFYVTDDGVALTNAHVVEGCSGVSLDGQPAEVMAVSSVFDLAALRLIGKHETSPLAFGQGDASLNADITIAGYPLHGLLGGLNVSRGSVSSLKGLQGDETSFQISAPVQPGNSGGPVIDRNGAVVGVVVAKLDAVAVADAIGDIAQNVNFAIRGSLAKAFMSSNGIAYDTHPQAETLAPEDAAVLLQNATHLVECH
ncbi:trypsin-like peptidase domain-containing protein [Roseivivax sp. CAU 1761]